MAIIRTIKYKLQQLKRFAGLSRLMLSHRILRLLNLFIKSRPAPGNLAGKLSVAGVPNFGSDDPGEIIRNAKGTTSRWCGINGFEGLALDDALVYSDLNKYYSFLPFAKAIGQIGKQHFRKNFSVLELGCGSGCLFEFLRFYGCNRYTGLDINNVAFRNSPIITRHSENFLLADLQEEFNINETFDIVTSCEVLEHIREDKLENFIQNISRHMHGSSVFIGTASLQHFDVHITVHEKEWWLEKFRKFGFAEYPDHERTEKILAQNHPFNWDAGNTNIFVLIKQQ